MVTRYVCVFDVHNQKLEKATFFKLGAEGTQDYFRARFNFYEGPWDPKNTIAVFTSADGNIKVEVELSEDGACHIPNDVVKKYGKFHVFLYSSDVDEETHITKFRIVTSTVDIYLYPNNVSLDGGEE